MAVKRRKPPAPPAPKKPRVAAKVPPTRQPEAVLTFGNAVAAAADAHPQLIKNPPFLPDLKTSLGALGPAITAAQNGGAAEHTALNETTIKVREVLDQHATWIQGQANVLPPDQATTLITTAGFSVVKAASRPTKNEGPANTKVSGTVLLELVRVAGALLYFWQMSTDQKTWSPALETERIKATLAGLTPGQLYYFRFRSYVRGKGYTGYSQTFPLIVT